MFRNKGVTLMYTMKKDTRVVPQLGERFYACALRISGFATFLLPRFEFIIADLMLGMAIEMNY